MISAKDARSQNLLHYFTGKPCRSGHLAEKFTKNDICVECSRIRSRKYYHNNIDRARKYRQQYYLHNKDAIKAKVRKYWRDKNGLPIPTRECPEVCEACGKLPTANQALHLDHCHETGKFRGWLCSFCNTALGLFGDNKEGVEKILVYLRRV